MVGRIRGNPDPDLLMTQRNQEMRGLAYTNNKILPAMAKLLLPALSHTFWAPSRPPPSVGEFNIKYINSSWNRISCSLLRGRD